MKGNLLICISLPFTLGVCCFTFLDFSAKNELPAAIVLGVLPFLFLIYLHRAKVSEKLLCIALFFSLGCLCALLNELSPQLFIPSDNIFSRCKYILEGKIDSLPQIKPENKALIKALLCGDKAGLSYKSREYFRQSGASHLLALSGLHLGLIAGIMDKGLSILGKSPKGYATRQVLLILCCAFYTLMCGASPSLLRAFLFILYRCTGKLMPQRKSPAINALLLSCLIQLCLDAEAVKRVSFQLSYLASLSLISLYPYMKDWLPGAKGLSAKIWDSLCLSLSCQLFTAPVVYLNFATLPKYFLLTNLFALPLCESLLCISLLLLTTSSLGCTPGLLCKIVDGCADIFLYLLKSIASIP